MWICSFCRFLTRGVNKERKKRKRKAEEEEEEREMVNFTGKGKDAGQELYVDMDFAG